MKTKILFFFIFFIKIIKITAKANPPAKVVVAKVFEKQIKKTSKIVAIIDFNKISSVSSEISGLITKIFFKEGDFVKKGKLLVNINQSLLNKDLEIMKKRFDEARIDIASYQKNLKRLEKLYKVNTSSEEDYDHRLYLYTKALKVKERIQKEIEKLHLKIEMTKIKAPFKGIVLEKFFDAGEWCTPGQAICKIASINEVYIKVSVSEEIMKYLTIEEKIPFTIPALNIEDEGRIKSFIPFAELRSKTFFVKIKIKYRPKFIQNMTAIVKIPISQNKKLKMIQRDALIKKNNNDFVYIVKKNKAVLQPVNIVVFMDKYVGIDNESITKHMSIVIEGNERLRDNQSVKIVKALNKKRNKH